MPKRSATVPVFNHVRPLKKARLFEVMNEAIKELHPQRNIQGVCCICTRLVFQKDLELLYEQEIASFHSMLCDNSSCEQESRFCISNGAEIEDQSFVCKECKSDLKKKRFPRYSVHNSLQFGRIPECLLELTVMEEQLISRYRNRAVILKLKFQGREDLQLSQRAILGNVIAFPHDSASIAKYMQVPCTLGDLGASIKVVLVGARKSQTIRDKAKKFCTVRRRLVYDAIMWKKEHDPFFSAVDIDMSIVNSLPEEDVPDNIWDDVVEDIVDDAKAERGYVNIEQEPGNESNLVDMLETIGYIDNEGNDVRLGDLQYHAWDSLRLQVPHDLEPVNEYSDDYWYGCFPTLFPYGQGGPSDPNRKVQLSFSKWVKYCIELKDERFKKHYSFIFIAFNIQRRREISKRARFRCKSGTMSRISATLRGITSEQLQAVSEYYRQQQSGLSDSTVSPMDENIRSLLNELKYVSGPIDGTVYSKIYRRNEIWATIVHYGLPAFWITLNPADLLNPLVGIFAGLSLRRSLELSVGKRMKLIVENPVSSVKFFHRIVSVFFDKMVTNGTGIFGNVATYYGMIEAQGRGSLHLHALIWLSESIPTHEFNQYLSTYERLRDVLAEFVDSIVSATIMEREDTGTGSHVCSRFPECIDVDEEEEFLEIVNEIVLSSNMHKPTHTNSCFKRGNSECRFNFPRPLCERTILDTSTNDITLKRNNCWVNPFNPYIAYVARCNHDVKYLGTGADVQALVYYLTEYTTKSELKTHELMALLGAAYDEINRRDVTESEKSRLLITRCMNKIGSVQETSAQMVTSMLLGHRMHYTDKTYVPLNWISIIYWMNQIDDMVMIASSGDEDSVVNSSSGVSGSNLRIDYMNRGLELASVSLYVYACCIYKQQITKAERRNRNNAYLFGANHPQEENYVQFRRKSFSSAIPTLIGPSFPRRASENLEMYAKAVLTLWKPWETISDLCSPGETWIDALTSFEEQMVATTGNPWFHEYDIPSCTQMIENLSVVRKCKEEALQLNKRRHTANTENDDLLDLEENVGNGETWREIEADAELGLEELPVLHIDTGHSRENAADNFVITGCRNLFIGRDFSRIFHISGSEFTNWISADEALCDHWERHMKEDLKEENSESTHHYRTVPDGTSILNDVIEEFQLNSNQSLVLKLIAEHVLTDNSEQLLLYVGGEAGTGKSQVIRSIVTWFRLFEKRELLCVCGTTGTAAAKIGGSTVHSIFKLRQKNLQIGSNTYVKLLESLHSVRYLLVDEVSMLDSKVLQLINARLQLVHGNTIAFGNICVVLLGDFYQFPPVLSKPIYDDGLSVGYNSNNDCDDALGRLLWKLFQNVIMLTENDRQQKDGLWLTILRNFISGKIVKANIDLLKSRIIQPGWNVPVDTMIVNRNATRHYANRKIIESILRSQDVNFVTFVALDKCRSRMIQDPNIRNSLLEIRDDRTESLPGKLTIFKGMKVMITKNLCPRLGIANGTTGTIYAIPNNDEVDYVLVQVPFQLDIPFQGLPSDVVPVFRITESFTVKEGGKSISIRRKQFPLIPAYAVTDYKAQGISLKKCLVDIRMPPDGRWNVFHALYVILSRVETLEGLCILSDFDDTIFNTFPPPNLLMEISRLKELNQLTVEKFGTRT